MKTYTTPNEKTLHIPSWLREKTNSFQNNPNYRCSTTATRSISGVIEQRDPMPDQNTNEELTIRTFCGLTPSVRITLSHRVFVALFSGALNIQVGQTTYRRRVFNEGLRAFDIKDYRYVEQNPRKTTEWGRMAREGRRILWIIRRTDNKWIGRIVEGTLTVL